MHRTVLAEGHPYTQIIVLKTTANWVPSRLVNLCWTSNFFSRQNILTQLIKYVHPIKKKSISIENKFWKANLKRNNRNFTRLPLREPSCTGDVRFPMRMTLKNLSLHFAQNENLADWLTEWMFWCVVKPYIGENPRHGKQRFQFKINKLFNGF